MTRVLDELQKIIDRDYRGKIAPFARAVNINYFTVNKWFKRGSDVPTGSIMQICAALHIPIESILGEAAPRREKPVFDGSNLHERGESDMAFVFRIEPRAFECDATIPIRDDDLVLCASKDSVIVGYIRLKTKPRKIRPLDGGPLQDVPSEAYLIPITGWWTQARY
jgi:hypothetical protein